MHYCESVYQTKRRPTREVKIGCVGVGGDNPVRIQSMTTSPTDNVEQTVDQIIRLSDIGCDIARVTVQGKKEAYACEKIKNSLLSKGYNIPLVADIHFYPPAAIVVADFVDKVRINPGNYADRRATFRDLEYSDETYQKELEKIEQKFAPLVLKCKEQGKSIRIGTNHGSLSDRIMNWYGDSPKGMVESAVEYATVCRKYDYHDLVFSMKASNTHVMIAAYRLLVSRFYELGWDYPIHLGVTEAGNGLEGRIKSAIGIGTMLLDGIGDTIRVSLTEDPWLEIDPCQRICNLAKSYEGKGCDPFQEEGRNFLSIVKRQAHFPKYLSLHRDGSVFMAQGQEAVSSDEEQKVDAFIVKSGMHASNQGETSSQFSMGDINAENPIFTLDQANDYLKKASFMPHYGETISVYIQDEAEESWDILKKLSISTIFLNPSKSRLHQSRSFFSFLNKNKIDAPVILSFSYDCNDQDMIHLASMECGALLCDGLGEGVFIQGDYSYTLLKNLSFNILQGSRMRFTKTEFISCPSCGRTLFDLQTVTHEIQERTEHLPGVKIAIMGCIVNGPGEMADADFGYVGSQTGKIDLYVGKECVEKNILFAEGPERLIDLIKKHDRWVEPRALAKV